MLTGEVDRLATAGHPTLNPWLATVWDDARRHHSAWAGDQHDDGAPDRRALDACQTVLCRLREMAAGPRAIHRRVGKARRRRT